MGAFVPPPGQPKPLDPSEFVSASQPSVVTFSSKNIQPAAPLYVRPEEGLLMRFINSSGAVFTARVTYRLILPNGLLQVAQQDLQLTNIPGVYQAFFLSLPEGFLIDLMVTVLGTVFRGQIFCIGSIARGNVNQFSTFATLIQDYLFTNAGTSWPGGTISASTAGPGVVHAIVLTTPAAGADFSFVAGVTQRLRVQAFTATLTTSATVANRIPRLQLKDQAGRLVSQSPPNVVQAAGTSVVYSAQPGQITTTTDTATNTWSLPSTPTITGLTLATSTPGIQTGDQWILGVLTVEEWIEP